VPAWSIGFGFATNGLSKRRLIMIGIVMALVAFAILELRFMLYGIRDHNAIF
jgi:hypothetical protein